MTAWHLQSAKNIRDAVKTKKVSAPEVARAYLDRIRQVDYKVDAFTQTAPVEGGATWYLPFTREAVPEVRLAEGKVVGVRPDEIE